MGVNSLWTVLGATARPVRLEALSRKKLAVDASIWIYQFLKAVRDLDGNALPQSHIVGFFRRICKLLYFGILPIFVFDGGAPALKRDTINERKQRRQGKSESVRDVAQKLLAIQVQRQLGKKRNTQTDQETVYFEDLPMNQVESQKRFLKKDEFHLPEITEFVVSKNDARVMARQDFDKSLADFDYVDGIDINTVDPKTKEFLDLPMATQYMILSHLRLKSRLRMGYNKDQLEALFPNSMDFSKFQIEQVQKRNFFTQKLMTVSGMDGEVGNVTRRIAGDSDRKYVLAKNDDGYTLALGNGSKSSNPIVLDENGEEEKSQKVEAQPQKAPQETEKVDSDSDSDFEDVLMNELPETQEEKNLQKALIESMYDHYEEFQKSEQNALEKSDASSDVQNVPKEIETKEIKTKEIETKEEDFELGKSFLFQPETESTVQVEPTSDDDLGSSFLFADKQVEDPSSGRSFLFPMEGPATKSRTMPSLKGSEREEPNDIKTAIGANDTTPAIKANDITPAIKANDIITVIKVNGPTPTIKANPVTHAIKATILEEAEVTEDSDIQSREEPESSEEPEPKAVASVPDWFKHDLDTNMHSTDFVNSKPNQLNKYKEDEDAGLITWSEAKEMLGDEEEYENYDADDLQEVSAASFEKPVEKPQKVEVDKPANQTRQAEMLDYDFEEDDENELLQQLRVEADDHETFKTQIRQTHEISLASIDASINNEQLLQEQLQKAKRDSDEVTQTMINDVQELLRRFGIPYITAPMEAEAQCAELYKLNLVDGIITDDSDCFLFGGDKIYKNMFNQKQFVECYIMDEIEAKVGLNQEKMIELALLLGSDYTTGVKGIGPVLAMEILAEFGSLKNFKKWFDESTKTTVAKETNSTGLRKTLMTRVLNGKLYLPDSFPENIITAAYTNPEVDPDKTAFKWGVPSLDEIRSYLMYNVSWPQARVDEVMIPLIRDMNRRKAEGVQSTIGEFFPQEFIEARKELGIGKRMKSAASKLNKRRKTEKQATDL